MKAVCERDADVIYTDEAVFESPDLHNIKSIRLKADFSQSLLETNNYVCHFTSFKKSLFDGLFFDSDCDGAQDFDVVLKLVERTKKIFHIQKCLYYWRASPASTASGASAKPYTTLAGKRALENHFRRIGEAATVMTTEVPNTYRIIYGDRSKISATPDMCMVKRLEPVFHS